MYDGNLIYKISSGDGNPKSRGKKLRWSNLAEVVLLARDTYQCSMNQQREKKKKKAALNTGLLNERDPEGQRKSLHTHWLTEVWLFLCQSISIIRRD